MQSEIQKINSAIMFGTWTDAELNSMIDAVKFARTCLQKRVKRGLDIGTDVRFYSTKRGATIHGSVTKIAQKYVTVKTMTGLWRVPANMLEVVPVGTFDPA